MASMDGARFLTRFELTDQNNTLDVNLTPFTIPPGYYYWSLDGAADDFALALKTAWEAAVGGTLTVEVMWVNLVTGDALTTAAGRVKLTWSSGVFNINFDNSTLDPRILGWPADTDDASSDPGGELVSPWVHRYGWYPQISAEELVTDRGLRNHVEISTGGYMGGLKWGQDRLLSTSFFARSPGLVRIDAGLDAACMGDIYATVGDENIAYEAWALDLCEDITKRFRMYEDSVVVSVFWGPYKFAPGPVWSRPLSGQTAISHKAGELWNVVISAREARG